jgi:peptidoglycan/LPS O-acetylase OafA/YrhL
LAEKLAYLEGLRGLAAFVVYLGHLFPLFIGISILSIAFGTWRTFSVCIFFVLSGYVLTTAFFSTGNGEYLVSGAVRRYIRLAVPVSVLLFLIYLVITPGLSEFRNPAAFLNMIRQVFWGTFFFGEISVVPLSNNYTGVLWTMAIEFIGSFLVFAFASLFGKLRNRYVFYAVAILVFLKTYYLAFILGMALADLYCNASREKYRIRDTAAVACVGGAGLFLGSCTFLLAGVSGLRPGMESLAAALAAPLPLNSTPPLSLGAAPVTEIISILGASLILLALLNSRWMQGFFSGRLPVFLGKISFSLYLVHMVVIYTFSEFIFRLFFSGPSVVAGLSITLVTTPVLLGVSCLMYRYVDLNGIAISKRAYTRFFVRTPPGETRQP